MIEITIRVFIDDEYFILICLDLFFCITHGINSRINREVKTGKIIHAEKKYSARPTGIAAIMTKNAIAARNSGKKFF